MNKENQIVKKKSFLPLAIDKVEDLDISEALVEDIMLRRLYTIGTSSIKELSESLKISFKVITTIFNRLRKQQFFEISGMEGYNYIFSLSGIGRESAGKRFGYCKYFGPAPVSMKNYCLSVNRQSSKVYIDETKLKTALSDLVVTDRFLRQLGPALVSQNSIFVYGPSGNGKTSVVTRLSRIYEDAVFIPYAVEYDGQVIVLYDPVVHQRIENKDAGLDPRWVLCRRPCITVGGELEPSMLELKRDEGSGVYAAPFQMRANNGILVIDDFGRQIVSPQYLLNRWIVPLDRRVDYLTLSYGIKFEIPFEVTVIFSSNLDPQDLADEAFLRRIQNKIYVEPVDAGVFERIFLRLLDERNLNTDPDSTQYLINLCQKLSGGTLKACFPADILDIIDSISIYEGKPIEISKSNLKRATNLYFTKTISKEDSTLEKPYVDVEKEGIDRLRLAMISNS